MTWSCAMKDDFSDAFDEEINEPREHKNNATAEPDLWPTLDKAAYHGIVGKVVEAIIPHSESDPVALLGQALAMSGNAIGHSPYHQVEGDRHRTNLFVVNVGPSAKGRKGTSLGRIKSIMKVADETWCGDHIKSGLSSGEGFVYEVRDEIKKYNPKKKQHEVIDPAVIDKRLMVVEPEFAGALAVMERPGNTLSPNIRNAWDGVKLQSLTKNSPLSATDPHISIVGHITVEELRARLGRTELANSFANRFLFFLVKRSKELPFGGEMTDSEIILLGERLKVVIEKAKLVGRVEMSDTARERWASIYHDLSESKPGLLGAVIARAEAQVVRFALIYALLDCTNRVDVPHLEAALAIWEHCEASAAYIFGNAVSDSVADEIHRALQQAGSSGMSRTAIRDLFGRNKSGDRIASALQLLLTMGRARFENITTGGRPVEVWFAKRT